MALASCCFAQRDRVKPLQQRPGLGSPARAVPAVVLAPKKVAAAEASLDNELDDELLPTVLAASTAEERVAELSTVTAQVEAFHQQAMEGLAALQKLKAAPAAAPPLSNADDLAVAVLRPTERIAVLGVLGGGGEEQVDDASVDELLALQSQAQAALAAMAVLQDMHMAQLGVEAAA